MLEFWKITSNPCDKTNLIAGTNIFYPWLWGLTYVLKKLTLLITIQQWVLEFHINIPCDKIFLNIDNWSVKKKLMPPRSKIGGILFLSCVSFYHSVLLSETWTLLIPLFYPVTLILEFGPFFLNFNLTFEQWVLNFWYFTRVFLVIRAFRGYQYFYPVTLEFDPFF